MSGALKILRCDVDGQPLEVSTHAVKRYAERASQFPDDPHRARRQLGQVVKAAGTVGARPGWVHDRPDGVGDAARWLLIGEDIAMPLLEIRGQVVATTCLARGAMSDAARARRREHSRKVRAQDRARREARSRNDAAPRWR